MPSLGACCISMLWRAYVGSLVLVGATLLARDAIAQTVFSFQAPHVVRRPAAALNPTFSRRIDREAAEAKMATPGDLIAFTLRTTASALHFGLGHRTRLSFDGVDREGNCVEYAELFASILNRAFDSRPSAPRRPSCLPRQSQRS
jgi:hypothetical protein